MAYIYRFKDVKNNIIYVGKTCRKLDDRMGEHFGGKGHLPKECYSSVAKIEYMAVKTDADALLVEVYLINKYRPIYNKQNKSNHIGQTINLDVSENWKTYRIYKANKEDIPSHAAGCFGVAGIAIGILYAIFKFFITVL